MDCVWVGGCIELRQPVGRAGWNLMMRTSLSVCVPSARTRFAHLLIDSSLFSTLSSPCPAVPVPQPAHCIFHTLRAPTSSLHISVISGLPQVYLNPALQLSITPCGHTICKPCGDSRFRANKTIQCRGCSNAGVVFGKIKNEKVEGEIHQEGQKDGRR